MAAMFTHILGRLFNKHVSVTTGSSLYVLQRFYNLGREETHTHVATHLRASHPHCSHYDPSSSPTDLLIIAAPKPTPSHTYTHAHSFHTQYHTGHPFNSVDFFRVSHNSPQWTNGAHTETKKASLYYTFQTSTVLAPCNLVPLTLLHPGQMEPY